MGKIRKILETELVGGTQSTDVYPVTSTKAVYDENNERLDNIINRRGVVNISTNYNSDHIAEVLTLSQAIAKVPSSDRVLGFQGNILTSDGWATYKFTGTDITQWGNTSYWALVADSVTMAQEGGLSKEKAISQRAATIESLKRLRRITILDEEKCKGGSRYADIENLILDLEIISSSGRNFAPVSFYLSRSKNISIDFFEVDTDGHYLPTFKYFTIDFNTKERTLLYVLDKEVSIDGYTAKVSIAIDSSAITVDFDAYSPSFVSDSVRGEHWGLISILRMLQNTDTDVATLQDRVDKLSTASADVNDTKQSRISLFDMEKCASNPRISQILDFLLDLELHWDDGQDDEVYALVSISGGGESKSLIFYAVDENGKYLNTFHAFYLNFGKVTGVKYLLDQKITTSSGKTGTCSIVVDWDKWTFNLDGLNPCYHSNSIYSEHAGPIMYLRQLAGLGNQLAGLGVQNVRNGSKVTYLTTANNTGSVVSNVTSNSFEISTDFEEYIWSYTAPPFTPSGNNYIHVKCKLEDLTPDLKGSHDVVDMWLSDGRSTYDANGCVFVGSFSTEIDYKFDPAYYTVYKNWTEFGVWLSISAGSSGGTKRWRVTDFEVYEDSGGVNGLSGNNAKELFEDVASKLSDINSEIEGLGEVDTELISPSGNKFELSVQDDGTLKALPIIPNKGAFFGNSLLVGSGYGMAASDDQHDYYYLINSYIKSLNGSYTYNKYAAFGFEGITSEDAIESAVNAVVNNLTGDETLVSIQLGDNVNTIEKNTVFPASSLALCKAVRAKCPNARVVWMGMWYSSDSKYQAIQNACKQTGCKFISYEGLKGSDANSKIGNIQKKSFAQRTISDVTNVVENSSSGSTKNITVTFTVSGSPYTSTLDVSSYSLSGGTLTYTSEYDIITAGGVASHPGDEGFRRISNRFLYEMKLTDDQEYYKKSE